MLLFNLNVSHVSLTSISKKLLNFFDVNLKIKRSEAENKQKCTFLYVSETKLMFLKLQY
jgi:hypothetical protein